MELMIEVRLVDLFELVGLVNSMRFWGSLVRLCMVGGIFRLLKVGMFLGMICSEMVGMFCW